MTGIPWEQRCPLSFSHHLWCKGVRGALRGIGVYQELWQLRPHLPCSGRLPTAGEPSQREMQAACGSAEAHIQSEAPSVSRHVGWGSDCSCRSLSFPICEEAIVISSPHHPPHRVVCTIKRNPGVLHRVVETTRTWKWKPLVQPWFYGPLAVWLWTSYLVSLKPVFSTCIMNQ